MESQSRPVLIPLPLWSCTGTGRVVVLDDLGGQDPAQHQLDDRLQQLGGDGHPVAHRRPGELDAEPLEDSFQAIERQVIGIFADRDVSHQPRAGQTLLDRLGKPVGDHDVGLAGLAGILGADVFEHDQRRGDVFELLADFLADAGPLARRSRGRRVVRAGRRAGPACGAGSPAAACGRGPSSWAHPRWASAPGPAPSRGGCWSGLRLRQDFLGEEQELSGVDPLALPAVALAEELFELVLELLVEMDLLTERLQQLADELMGRFEVVGEWVRDGDHTLYYVDGCSYCLRNILRILKRSYGPGVADAPSGRVQVDAGQEGGEFGGGHLDAIGGGGRNAEGSALESLGPDGQTIAVPIQDLDAIATLVDEDEEMTGEGIERQAARCQGGQAVEALAHVGRFFGEVNADRGAQSEHGRSSTTAMRRRRVWGSNPGATAIRRPLERMSSR